MSKNKVIITAALVLAVIVLAGLLLYKFKANERINTPSEHSPQSNQAQQSATSSSKTYRSEKWGFEFQYPKDWIVQENTFKNYYSKFNLSISKPKGSSLDLAFDVNVVLPEFIKGFDGLEKTISEVTVDGVKGIKYEYEYEGFPETTVILPLGDLRIILGTGGGGGTRQYLDEFNQILATFKFLK